MNMRIAAGLFLFLLPFSGCGDKPELTTSSPEALQAYTEGLAQYDRFYFTEAKAQFERALNADSGFAMAWARLAIVEMSIKDEARARELIQKALRLAGDSSQRERLFIRMWHERLHFNTKAAAATADSLATLYPQQKEVYLFRGNIYEQEKNMDAAIRSYQRALQADTGYALAAMTLGYAYSNVGEEEKAVAQMQRYIRLAPAEPDPHASYADILMRAGRFDEALEQYRKSLALKSDYWYAIREIGRIYEIKGRLKDAERQYHESYKYLPQNRQLEATHFQADAGLASARGRYQEAAELFQKALQIDTVNLQAAYGLALSLARLERYRESREIADRIREEFGRRELLSSPAMTGYFFVRSEIAMREGRLDEALAMCDSAFNYALPVARAFVHRQMAEVYLRQKDYEQALVACEEGLAQSPNSPNILLTLTRIYKARGDRRLTAQIGGRLLEFWKDADPDFQHRREVLRLIGRPV